MAEEYLAVALFSVPLVGHMDDKKVEIEGEAFDLGDPEAKKAAIRAWLAAKSKDRENPSPPEEEHHSPEDVR